MRFTAIAVAGSAGALRLSTPESQVGIPSAAVPLKPAVVAVDSFGNAKAGIEVTFEVSGGDGRIGRLPL